MDFYRHLFTKTSTGAPVTFMLVYLVSIIFTFQTLLTAYSSSSYLEQFISPQYVGSLFAVGAALAILITLALPRLLRRLGNVLTTFLLVLFINISLLFVGLAISPLITLVAFVVYLALNPQVYLNIDIFLETLIGDAEGKTGSKRGLILSIMSAAAFFSPLAMGYLIGSDNNLSAVYYAGAGVGLLMLAILVTRFRHFYDPEYKLIKLKEVLSSAAKQSNIKIVLSTQFLLQFFYTWAVIYFPLYLATEIGLPWSSISLILASGLFAFVIFEYPIGLMADRHWGEKEMMAVGFVVLVLAASTMTFLDTDSVLLWMLLMFFSRFGASLVEVTTESYFFKQVKGDQPNLISLFRLTRPLANLIGALVGSIALAFLPFNFIFFILAAVMASGVFITSYLVDTK